MHPSARHAEGETRRPWSALILLSVAQFMVVLDITVVNVALPSIGEDLGIRGADLQWVVTIYVLLTGGLLLLGGRIADVLARRGVFLAGLALFTVATLLSGLAESGGTLIASRAGQGGRRGSRRRRCRSSRRSTPARSAPRRSAPGARSVAPAPRSAWSSAACSPRG
jgi:Major Facilitator Superfamily